MENQFLISAFGPDKPGIVEELSNMVLKNNCSVADSRMAVLGDHFSVLMLITGEGKNLRSLETDINKIDYLTITFKEVKERKVREDVFVYSIKVVGEDTKGLVHKITAYYKSLGINVINMDTSLTHAPVSGMPMFSMAMQVEVLKETNIRDFKQGLSDLCDRLNIDVDIEQVVV